MVGDDVVDLADPEAREDALHPRFDARVFAPAERAALAASAEPGRLRWVLWAAKEAAFKLARKRDPRAGFSPSRFLVSLDAPRFSGCVLWAGGEARVQVRRVGDAAHATARDGRTPRAGLVRGVARLEAGDDPSRAARELARRGVARRLGLDPGELAVVRRGRIPGLALPGGGALDLSLSHHGGFVSFACELGPQARAGARTSLSLAELHWSSGPLRAPLAGVPGT